MAEPSEIERLLAQYGTPEPLAGPPLAPRQTFAQRPYDMYGEEARPPSTPQLTQSNAIDQLLSVYGSHSRDRLQEGLQGNATPQDVTHSYFEGLFGPPIGPFGMARGPSLMTRLGEVPREPVRNVLPSDLAVRRYQVPSGQGQVEQWRVGLPNNGGLVDSYIDPATRSLRIIGSDLPPAQHGQGLGLAMYQRLIDDAHRAGYRVHSDSLVSQEAQRIYDALARRGYIVERHPSAQTSNPITGSLGTGENGAPVFTVLPPPRD